MPDRPRFYVEFPPDAVRLRLSSGTDCVIVPTEPATEPPDLSGLDLPEWEPIGFISQAETAIPGDAAIHAFPGSFDERQRPKCGRWDPLLGPCVCGDPSKHE
jgi:hypothetical protein